MAMSKPLSFRHSNVRMPASTSGEKSQRPQNSSATSGTNTAPTCRAARCQFSRCRWRLLR